MARKVHFGLQSIRKVKVAQFGVRWKTQGKPSQNKIVKAYLVSTREGEHNGELKYAKGGMVTHTRMCHPPSFSSSKVIGVMGRSRGLQ